LIAINSATVNSPNGNFIRLKVAQSNFLSYPLLWKKILNAQSNDQQFLADSFRRRWLAFLVNHTSFFAMCSSRISCTVSVPCRKRQVTKVRHRTMTHPSGPRIITSSQK
jgi:hypothetical protein